MIVGIKCFDHSSESSVRLSDSVPSCGGWSWLYFVVRSSDRVVVVDVDLLTAGCVRER